MEKYSIFLDRKNQYCENDYTTKCNLQLLCDPYQITNGVFHSIRIKNFTIHMATQKTLNSQSSPEKEERSWRNQPSWLQIKRQSYSHEDSMLLLLSHFSCVWLCANPQTAAHQALPSLGFSRQECWSGCHCVLQCMKGKKWK